MGEKKLWELEKAFKSHHKDTEEQAQHIQDELVEAKRDREEDADHFSLAIAALHKQFHAMIERN
eukprot:NODE_2891_length_728_cov_205.163476_g2040_i0.p3 GENE.NODE_2891_length_728_cov_205.163476_g2040_i0~~NODE_2891_length_728_cov_205.163476_g2040_i0.p3  ORF type:complete len:64 (+),score=29.73 NODE_2891_length_728_cov_205.163476_g2040_i0:29-220(+)